MKKVLLPISALFVINSINAQTITEADFGSVGDVYNTTIVPAASIPNTIAPGTAGTGKTWDFSALPSGAIEPVKFLDPATTGMAADFPGANIAVESQNGLFFMNKSTAGVDVVGGAISAQGLTIKAVYAPNQKLLEFPASVGTTYSTTSFASDKQYLGIDTNMFGTTIKVDSIWIKRKTKLDVEFDASGTLKLSGGDYNTVRSYSEEVTNDTILVYSSTGVNFMGIVIPIGTWVVVPDAAATFVGLDGGITQTTTRIYNWYAPGEKFSVCALYVNGSDQIEQAIIKHDPTYSVYNAEGVTLSMFPNPTKDVLNFTSSADLTNANITIYDMSGKAVVAQPLVNNGQVNVANLADGTYMYTITNAKSAILSRGKFVVAK